MNQQERSYRAYVQGLKHLKNADLERARACFELSIDFAPHFKAHHRLAQIHAALGNEEQEGRHLALGLALCNRNDKIAVDFAAWLARTRQLAGARTILHSTLRRNANYTPAKRLLDSLCD